MHRHVDETTFRRVQNELNSDSEVKKYREEIEKMFAHWDDRVTNCFLEKSFEEQEAAISQIIQDYPTLSVVTEELSKYCVPKEYVASEYFRYWRHAYRPMILVRNYADRWDEYELSEQFRQTIEEDARKDLKNYLISGRVEKSLFDSKEGLNLAMRLCDFVGQKTIETGSIGNETYGYIKAFMYYTAQQIENIGFDAPIILPEVFKSKAFIDTIKNDKDSFRCECYSRERRFLFSANETIREWIMKEKEFADRNGEVFFIPTLTPADLNNIFKKYPWPEVENVISAWKSNRIEFGSSQIVGKITSTKDLIKEAEGKVDGIFVDVDETLLIDDCFFNKNLYESMIEWKKAGEKVTIFTGGNIFEAKERLEKAGLDVNLFPIESKEKYRGFLFTGYIIDDWSPYFQGFIMENDENYSNPFNPSIFVGGNTFNKMLAKFKGKETIKEETNSLQDVKVAGYSLQHKILDPAIIVSKIEPIAKARHYSLLPKILEEDINISGNNNKQHD